MSVEPQIVTDRRSGGLRRPPGASLPRAHFGPKIDSVHRVEGCENASQTHNIISRPHLHIPCSFLGPPGTFGFTPQGLIIVAAGSGLYPPEVFTLLANAVSNVFTIKSIPCTLFTGLF